MGLLILSRQHGQAITLKRGKKTYRLELVTSAGTRFMFTLGRQPFWVDMGEEFQLLGGVIQVYFHHHYPNQFKVVMSMPNSVTILREELE